MAHYLLATTLAGHRRHNLTSQRGPALDKWQSFLQVVSHYFRQLKHSFDLQYVSKVETFCKCLC